MADLQGMFVGHGLNTVVGPWLEPRTRISTYSANALHPNLIPSMADLIDYYQHSNCSPDLLRSMLAMHGVAEPGSSYNFPEIWTRVINRQTNSPPLPLLLALYYRRLHPGNLLKWLVDVHGFKDELAAQIMLGGQPKIWEPEQVRILYRLLALESSETRQAAESAQGYVTYADFLKTSGLHLKEDRELFEKLFQPPTYGECITAFNRDIIDEPTFRKWITLEGFTEPKTVDVLHKLAANIPSPAELVDFSVKNVFSKEITERFGYDDEFDQIPSFQLWMKRNGYTGNPTLSADDLAKLVQAGNITQEAADEFAQNQDPTLTTWAQAHWRAHWINPSPTQAYQMLQRQRPEDPTRPLVDGKLQPRMPVVPGSITAENPGGTQITPTTQADVDLILRANDYVPRFRPALSGLSYAVLRLVDIRRIVELSIRDPSFQDRTIGLPCIDANGVTLAQRIASPTDAERNNYLREWARQQFLDRGQTPDSATALAELALAGGRRVIHAPQRANLHRWERRWEHLGERSYLSGRISTDQYGAWSFPKEYYEHSRQNQRLVLDEEAKQAAYEEGVRNVRLDFRDGAIGVEEAQEMLGTLGMVPGKITDTIRGWSLRMNTRHALVRTADIIKWYNDLLITRDDAAARLQRLGWSRPESILELELPPPKTSKRAKAGG